MCIRDRYNTYTYICSYGLCVRIVECERYYISTSVFIHLVNQLTFGKLPERLHLLNVINCFASPWNEPGKQEVYGTRHGVYVTIGLFYYSHLFFLPSSSSSSSSSSSCSFFFLSIFLLILSSQHFSAPVSGATVINTSILSLQRTENSAMQHNMHSSYEK